MSTATETIEGLVQKEYKYGFYTDVETDSAPPGLNEDIVRLISSKKNEPPFLLEWRLKAFRHWLTMKEPTWPHVKYPPIEYQSIVYYSAPRKKGDGPKSLDEVDPKLLETYEKLGIPLRERERLAGVAVDAVFDSVSVGTTFKKQLGEKGIIFCSFSEAVQEHPELVKKYLGTVVPYSDNFFAPLNAAVFSDGSFCFIPKGVRCPMELSTYFRINAANTGQFERTLIIAEEGASVSYLEGCSAPMRDEHQLHAAVVELIAWTTPPSSTRRSRTGTRATKRGAAAFTTSSPSAASARGRTRRSPGRRSKPDRRSPGSIRGASSRARTRSGSSTRWR